MSNRHLSLPETTLALNKAEVLLKHLKEDRDTFQTQSAIVQEFLKAMRKLCEDAVGPLLKLRKARAGTPPIRADYNDQFEELGQDLTVVFKELSTLENLILKNFNFMVSERDSVNKLLKRINSKLGDYILYVDEPTPDAIYFLDSFNDVSRIDFGSDLLETKQCEILPAEGIVTLPVVFHDAPAKRVAKVTINENSNGTPGNYQELDVAPHENIKDILDSNPYTWFEYERVQSTLQENVAPLVLDLTFYFEKAEIVNHVRVNPNNFGTIVPVAITNIQTSYDGKEWTSIKDDIPVLDYLGEDEENIFTLAPASSKFAGQGLYTFTPRKVKYVRIALKQDTAYSINTSSGLRHRYAIGIRDVEFYGHKYESKGELVSAPFTMTKEIQKISLIASENPLEKSTLADIEHQISVDDGATWHSIQPQDRSGTEIPEILNINTSDSNAVLTENPAYAIRHRMIFERNASKFTEGAPELARKTKKATELFSIPSRSPLKFTLSRPPIDGTISIINPLWGGRDFIPGETRRQYSEGDWAEAIAGAARGERLGAKGYILGISNGRDDEFNLPLDLVALDLELDDIYIWVDSVRWKRVGTFAEKTKDPWYTSSIYLSPTSKVYTLDKWGKLKFGGPDEEALAWGQSDSKEAPKLGALPPAGATISFTLKEEGLDISPHVPHRTTLLFPADGDKANVKIYRTGSVTAAPAVDDPRAFELRAGVRSWDLPHSRLIAGATDILTDSTTYFQEDDTDSMQVPYIDGATEFGFDYISYFDTYDGDKQYWSVDMLNGILATSPNVDLPTDETIHISYYYVPFYWLDESEWDFVETPNGLYQEIEIKADAYREPDATRYPYIDEDGARSFWLINNPSVEQRIVPNSVVIPSSWLKDGPVPHQVAFIDGVTEFTQVADDVDVSGFYSVDAKNCKAYLGGELDIGAPELEVVTFRYTSYGVLYNITKPLETSEYTVDIANGEIEIDSKKALDIWGDLHSSVKQDALVRIDYEYAVDTGENIKDLEPYFSPVCRAAALKILPTGSLEY